MPFPSRASVRFAVAVGLLLLPILYSGQTLHAQRPSDPYYEFSGMWLGNYAIDPGRARMAVLAALANLHMPVYQEGLLPYGTIFDTKTPDNYEARLTLLPLGRTGEATRIGVRIGGFGTHRQVCARILDEIARHLDEARRSPPAPAILVIPAPAGRTASPPLIIVRPGATAPPSVPTPPTPPAPPPPPALPPPTPAPSSPPIPVK